MRRQTIRVLVLGRFEERYADVMAILERNDKFQIVDVDRAPDVIVELRHPECWKKMPKGKRFPAVVVVAQAMSPCTEDEAYAFHADDYVDSTRYLVDAVIEADRARRYPETA
jgi:hypothetical protein